MKYIKRFHNSISSIRSHHWKYYCDIFTSCTYRCKYCLYYGENQFGDGDKLSVRVSEIIKEIHALNEKGIVYLGATADIYQGNKEKQHYTREVLKAFLQKEIPLFLITRSPKIISDLDILERMAKKDLIEVSISACTKNDDFRKIFEPGTVSLERRLDIAAALKERGITFSYHFSPIIPFLDSPEMLNDIALMMHRSGSSCIYTCLFGLNIRFKENVIASLAQLDGLDVVKFKAVYPEVRDAEFTFPNSEYSFEIIRNLSNFCRKKNISFISAQFPALDTCLRTGGIFEQKLPTIGDLNNHFLNEKKDTICLNEIMEYISRFKAVDAAYTSSIEKHWHSKELFKNTSFFPEELANKENIYKKGKNFSPEATVMHVA